MNITLVPSPVGTVEESPRQFLTSFLINDRVAIDAGSLGFYHTAQEQANVKHVFLTHTHIDHLASLPIFVENAYEGRVDCVTIHGSADVLSCLRTDIFNGRLWPDFIGMSSPQTPFLRLATLKAGETVEVEGLRLTPVPVDHVVPTFGFLVEDAGGTVVIATDTAPTEEIWQCANKVRNLKAVFLETTFPDELTWLAGVSKHLTPALFSAEVRKIHSPVPIVVVHLKARYATQVAAQLEALGLANVSIGKSGIVYTF